MAERSQLGVHSTRLRAVLITIGLALSSFVIGNIVVLAVATALETVGFQVYDRPAIVLFLSVVLLQGVTFGGVALGYLKLRGLGWNFIRARIPSLRDLAVTLGGFLLLIVILVVASNILSYVGIESAQNQIIEIGDQNPVVFLLLVPLSFLLVGPGEELLFRGLIQGTLAESFHPIRAIILASGLFAIVHLFHSLARESSSILASSSPLLSCWGRRTSTLITSSCRHSFTVHITPFSSVAPISRQLAPYRIVLVAFG